MHAIEIIETSAAPGLSLGTVRPVKDLTKLCCTDCDVCAVCHPLGPAGPRFMCAPSSITYSSPLEF